ncbi:MAG: hypothetical protein VW982_02430 [Candidatus Poseidoniales archaeon]|jgi:hypothetical protein
MDWKRFAGPAILVGLAILLYVGVNALGAAKYDEGDTIASNDMMVMMSTYCLSVSLCLGSIVWFAFALGGKTEKVVFLSEDSDHPQHGSVPPASDSQSTAVPSTVGGDPVSYVREKFIIAKSESNAAQMVGFLIIAGSVAMFVLMILFGFFWILSGMGSGLGGSGGTCDETCESLGSAAKFSMWATLLLFPCGLIALARPWSWFSSGQDIHDPVVKVRLGIVSGIALIAVISFGWPALLVIGTALIILAAKGWAN